MSDTVDVIVDGVTASLSLVDTPERFGYDRLRSSSFCDTDVFFICFSLIDTKSYQDVYTNWHLQILSHFPNTLTFLVGTKRDLVRDVDIRETLKRRKVLGVDFGQKEMFCKGRFSGK